MQRGRSSGSRASPRPRYDRCEHSSRRRSNRRVAILCLGVLRRRPLRIHGLLRHGKVLTRGSPATGVTAVSGELGTCSLLRPSPIALALVLYWPIRIAVYGSDLFRTGGADGRGAGELVAWIFYGFVIWSLGLLLVGVRTVHGWTWARSIAGVAWAAAIGVGLAVALTLLYAAG